MRQTVLRSQPESYLVTNPYKGLWEAFHGNNVLETIGYESL